MFTCVHRYLQPIFAQWLSSTHICSIQSADPYLLNGFNLLMVKKTHICSPIFAQFNLRTHICSMNSIIFAHPYFLNSICRPIFAQWIQSGHGKEDPYLLNGFNLLMVKHHTGSQWIQSAQGKEDPYLLKFNLLMVKHHTGSQWIQSAHAKTSYGFPMDSICSW